MSNEFKVPIIGTNIGGSPKYKGYVPVLDASGHLSTSMLPPAARSYIQNKSITIEMPTDGDVFTLFYTTEQIVLKTVVHQIQGIPTSYTQYNIHFGPNVEAEGTKVFAVDKGNDAQDGPQKTTSFTNPIIPADSFVYLQIHETLDTPTKLHVTIVYV